MPSEDSPNFSPNSIAVPSSPTYQSSLDQLKYFLATAPTTFSDSIPSLEKQFDEPGTPSSTVFNRFSLPTGECISCVYWNGLYHISGTDILRALAFRFLAFGRPVVNTKKFEEGVFSDLRNLKSPTDATLEPSKSQFLELLFKNNCIRTQKKQKVFFWFSVPHDRLFLDALDRDLKRARLGLETSTRAEREPALSFQWNPEKSLSEQFSISFPSFPQESTNNATTSTRTRKRRRSHSNDSTRSIEGLKLRENKSSGPSISVSGPVCPTFAVSKSSASTPIANGSSINFSPTPSNMLTSMPLHSFSEAPHPHLVRELAHDPFPELNYEGCSYTHSASFDPGNKTLPPSHESHSSNPILNNIEMYVKHPLNQELFCPLYSCGQKLNTTALFQEHMNRHASDISETRPYATKR